MRYVTDRRFVCLSVRQYIIGRGKSDCRIHMQYAGCPILLLLLLYVGSDLRRSVSSSYLTNIISNDPNNPEKTVLASQIR